LSFLDCENGKKVDSKTLVATINPDYNSPSIKSSISQKDSLYKQISNIESIINQTKNNFSIQIDSLKNQQKDIENQIEIQNANLKNLEEQKLS
jgi:septal ring factor EnvC (AmiA/AmiB activator)